MRYTGKLEYSTVEGGAWMLVSDEGERFLLAPAPVGEKAGTRVEIDGNVDEDVVSFQMVGSVLHVRGLRRL